MTGSRPRPQKRESEASTLTIVVPGTPVSVNHYVKHTRSGRHYVTREAKAFKSAVCLLVGGRIVGGRWFRVDAIAYLAKGQRGDTDNFSKLIGDGLAEAGAIHSDAAIVEWRISKRRDPEYPRTEITVRAVEPGHYPSDIAGLPMSDRPRNETLPTKTLPPRPAKREK